MPRTSVKSPDAFRTISEAADALDLPQHVLRFWETRFSQIKPMKRSGGRRYYRPTDIALLQGIRHLLYEEGYTIKGVQRILREQGIAHVAGLGTGLAPPKALSEPEPVAMSAPSTRPAASPVAVSAPASVTVKPEATSAPAVQPPTPNIDPIQQALTRPPPVRAEPVAVSMQPASAAESAQTHAALVQPVPQHSTQHQPAPVPAAAPPEPELQTQKPSAFPPLGSSSTSTLRFVPELEASAEHAPPDDAVSLPLQPQSAPETSVAQEASIAAPSNVQQRLSPQNTETLVQALRTLLDCKAILDSARQPTPKPNSANT